VAFQGRPLIVQIKQRIEVCPSAGIKPVSYDASNHKTMAGIRKTVQRPAWYIVSSVSQLFCCLLCWADRVTELYP